METDRHRYERLKKEGICVVCKNAKAEEGFVSCKSCREKQRGYTESRRKWYRLNKICPYCGSEKLMGEESICLLCGAKKYESNMRHTKSYNAEYSKARVAKLKESGVCTQCAKRKAEEHYEKAKAIITEIDGVGFMSDFTDFVFRRKS